MWAIAALVLLLLLLIFCTLGFLIEVVISNYRISRLKKKSKFIYCQYVMHYWQNNYDFFLYSDSVDPMTVEEVIEMRDGGQMDMDDNNYEDTIAVPSTATTQQNRTNTLENNEEEDHEYYGNVAVSSQSDIQSPQREAEVDGHGDQVYDQPFMNNTEPPSGTIPPPQVILSRAKTSSLPSDINSEKPSKRHTYVNLAVAEEDLHARSCQQLERARSPDYYLTLLDEKALKPSSTNSLPISRSCTFVSTRTSEGATSRLKADTSARPASIVLSPNPSYETHFRRSLQESQKPKTAPKPLHLKVKKPVHINGVTRGPNKFSSTKATSKASKSTSQSTSQTLSKPVAYSIDTNVSTTKSPSYENLEVQSTRHPDNNFTDEDEIELSQNPSYESSEVLDFYRSTVGKSNGLLTAAPANERIEIDDYETYV